jgi:hypothetical protein
VAVARAAGVEENEPSAPDGSPPLAPSLRRELDPFRDGRAEGPIVVFLVDSFGWNAFRQWSGDGGSPIARKWGSLARPLHSTFPTTTTSALVTLSTGVPPGRHGIVGHRQYLPRWGTVADMLRMTPSAVGGFDLLVGPEWRPSDVCGSPTLFRRGLSAAVVSRDRFEGTGFTRVLYDGADYLPYVTASDLAHELVRVLERPRSPACVYVYWDELDTVLHVRGTDPFLFALEADRVAQLVSAVARRVAPSLARRTTLLVTGDHGQVGARPEDRVALERHPDVVVEMRHPLAGDRRAGFFASRPGREGSLTTRLRAILPAGSSVIPMEEARRAGLFGPPPFHPELSERTGDLLALVPPPAGLTYAPPGTPTPKRQPAGAHGGLHPDELFVPLVTGALSEYTEP